jgi:hypothetical protein
MPTDEFEENRNFLRPEQAVGIDQEAFRLFVERHGVEFAKGYIAAIRDFQPQVKNIFIRTSDGEKFRRPTPGEMRSEASNISKGMELLLHFASAFLSEQSNHDANITPAGPQIG